MFIGRIDESLDGSHRLLEFLQELLMLLIAPASAQRIELTMHDGELVLHLGRESPERGRETPKLLRIDNGLCHENSPLAFCSQYDNCIRKPRSIPLFGASKSFAARRIRPCELFVIYTFDD